MGNKYLEEANWLREEIKRLYEHGRHTGYKQARKFLNEISDLMASASQSRHGKTQWPLIYSIHRDMQQLMDEWGEEVAPSA